MRTIIIDDEKHARIAIREEVELIADITLIGESDSIKSGIEMIESLQPDLLLLDIQLGDGMAFDLLDYFDKKNKLNFKIIMTTAYSDYALRAFKFSAIDYLLKPVDFKELSDAIKRIKDMEQGVLTKSFKTFIHNHLSKDKKKRIAFHTSEGVRIVEIDEIIRLNSMGNYTRIYFKGGSKLMISKPLKDYDLLLSEFHFYRIHASHLINMHYLKEFNPKNGGEVTLENGDVLPVSQRKRAGFLKELDKYSV